jgi:hypothetical protein
VQVSHAGLREAIVVVTHKYFRRHGATVAVALKRRPKDPPPIRRAQGEGYLVLWWHAQTPYASLFRSEFHAVAAAEARNAVLIELRGSVRVEGLVDYYRRDKDRNPMPFAWRQLEEPRKDF